MAIKSVFTCVEDPKNCSIEVEETNGVISITLYESGRMNEIHLNIYTAVKFYQAMSNEIRIAKNK